MREGWKKVSLDTLCDIVGGGTPTKSKEEYYSGQIPWATVRDMRSDVISDTELSITELGLKKSSSNVIPKGNVIIATRVGLGKTCFINRDTAINQDLKGVIPKNANVLSEFLFWWFKSVGDEIIKAGTGATVQGVKLPFIKSLQIPNIPLTEQKQIVALLDRAFAAIDQAKANIEKNIDNAKELFQSKLNEIFSQKGEGWEEKTLGEVCYVLNGYAFKSKDTVESSSTQLLRMGNLYKNVLDLSRKPVFYPEPFSEVHKDFLLKEGDLIMSLTGTVDKTDYGYTVKVPKVDVDLLLNQRIMKIEVHDSNILNKDYLKNYLLSPDFLSRLYETASGTRQANLSSRTILTLKINYPVSIGKQLEVVKQFKQLKSHTHSIEARYNRKLNSLEELKKSILQKAFAGELVKGETESILQMAAEPKPDYTK